MTGTVSGHLYMWEDNRLSRAVKAHDSSVNVLRSIKIGYISGGKEGGAGAGERGRWRSIEACWGEMEGT